MTGDDPVDVTIAISAGPADAAERDGATRDLLTEILQTDVRSADLAPGEAAPPGARGQEMTNAIIGGLTSGTIPLLVTSIHAWLGRRRDANSVTMSAGLITVELAADMTLEQQAAVVAALQSAAEN